MAVLGGSVYLISDNSSDTQSDNQSPTDNTSSGEGSDDDSSDAEDRGDGDTDNSSDKDGDSANISVNIKELESEEYSISETLVVYSTVRNEGNVSGSYSYEVKLVWEYEKSETATIEGELNPDTVDTVESKFYLALSGDVEVLLDGDVVDSFHVNSSGSSSSSSQSDRGSGQTDSGPTSNTTGKSNTGASGSQSV